MRSIHTQIVAVVADKEATTLVRTQNPDPTWLLLDTRLLCHGT